MDNHSTNRDGLKAEVKNFRTDLAGQGVNPEHIFQAILVEMPYIQDVIKSNPEVLDGIRIYLSKKTDDPNNDDYNLLLIPCKKVAASGQQTGSADDSYYEDIIPDGDTKTYAMMVTCRRPPDCPMLGAALL